MDRSEPSVGISSHPAMYTAMPAPPNTERTAIAIRTMVWGPDGRASVEAGAGIVADSDPADEDLECANKARALLTAAAAARGLDPLVAS